MKDAVETKLKVRVGACALEVGDLDDLFIFGLDTAIGAIDLFFELVKGTYPDEHLDIVALLHL